MKKHKELGFWGLGAVLLVMFLIYLAVFIGTERRYQAAKAEYDVMQRQLYELGMGQRASENFDWERYEQAEEDYEAYRARHGRERRHIVKREMSFFGFVFLLWVLAALGRGVFRAAKWSVERDERRALEREQKRDPWE